MKDQKIGRKKAISKYIFGIELYQPGSPIDSNCEKNRKSRVKQVKIAVLLRL